MYRHGKAYRNELLVVRAIRTDREGSRVGFTAGRAVGNAVMRNRVKRRLREAVRSMALAPGRDLVINARAAAAQADYWRLRQMAEQLLGRAGVLKGSEEVVGA